MILAQVGDITKAKGVKWICNAANGKGPMRSGVAGAISRAGVASIQAEAFVECNKRDLQPGDLYVTSAGILSYEGILHLVTMKNPGGVTSLEIVGKCVDSLIKYCQENSIDSVALSALGTGVGRLKLQDVANIYIDKLAKLEGINFYIIDPDAEFISYFI